MQAILSAKDFSFTYAQSTEPTLRNIDFDIYPGEFCLLMGKSGSGKSTLINCMKKNQIPFGSLEGGIYYNGNSIKNIDDKVSASKIGYVGQNPENMTVTDTVWHELAFGLENLGFSAERIRIRVCETAEYFGMSNWFRSRTHILSGGQKQLLQIAAVMVMRPEILLLDEPVSDLDTNVSRDLINTLKQINRDFGTTIIMAEQRLEEVLPYIDKYIYICSGKIHSMGHPEFLVENTDRNDDFLNKILPVPTYIYLKFKKNYKGKMKDTPLEINSGRRFLRDYVAGLSQKPDKKNTKIFKENIDKKLKPVIRVSQLDFSYINGQNIIEDLDLEIYPGRVYSFVGGNGAGKTTFLKIIGDIYKGKSGKIKKNGKSIYMPQNPEMLFTEITVWEELAEVFEFTDKKNIKQKVEMMLEKLGLKPFENMHPYDLSGGQKQILAFGKILLSEPDILLLDEPTKALDEIYRNFFGEIIREFIKNGKTVLMVSHDLDFAARYSDFTGMIFNKRIIGPYDTSFFFLNNMYYTTATRKLSRGIVDGCILREDIIHELNI